MGCVRFRVQVSVPRQEFMNLIKVKCALCGKEFLRARGRVNEAKKFSWKQYCSIVCQSKVRNKQRLLKCSNPKCNRIFERQPSDIRSSDVYCSRSCAVSVNNSKFPKKQAVRRKCYYCGKEYKEYFGGEKYCSRECKNKDQVISREEILDQIKKFYYKNKRIPMKIESPHYNAAQERFGSWNSAIKAAGFEPNPVVFSKKFIADDGHKCNSFAEKIIDNWLYEKKIKHEREISYPENRLLSVDFLVGNNFIEYFGLKGIIGEYDEHIKKKRKLSKKYKLSLIEIYPKDLFPVNHLSEIIKTKKL